MNGEDAAKHRIAKRGAAELKPHSIVNLGIGIPTLVAKYVNDPTIYFHSENGLLGVAELEDEKDYDPQRVNAGKLPVGEALGASYFNSSESFAMIRGGHIDVAMLGVLQVDEQGYIANWAVPGQNIIGVGGAMDLLSGAKKIIALTNHTDRKGNPKIVKKCTFPITSLRKVDVVITDLAVFEYRDGGLVLTELMPDSSLEKVKAHTEAAFRIDEKLLQEVNGS